MTISSTTNRTSITGNGVTTDIPVSFPFHDQADLVVIETIIATGVQTTKMLTTDYTIAGTTDAQGHYTNGGTVVANTAPASTVTWTVYRDPAITQLVDLVENDPLPVEAAVESPLDRLTMIALRSREIDNRCMRQPDGDTTNVSTLPPKVQRASMVLAFDADGNPIAQANVPTSGVLATAFTETLLDDTTAAQARTTLDAQQATESLTEDTDPDEAADFLAAYDTSAAAAKKVKPYRVRTRTKPGGRLTLTTTTPVTVLDTTGATTVYYSPYQGDEISLYDGTAWVPYQFTELSQLTTDTTKSPLAVAASKNYDVFVWNDSGTLRATRGPTWDAGAGAGSDTARGTGAGSTELELFEGRYVNKNAITNGPAARRGHYVGTIRSDASSQINDSMAKRHVWNNYNRVPRALYVVDTTDSWTYTTATLRQARASTANQLDFLIGVAEDRVIAEVKAAASNSAGPVRTAVGIGLDSTSAQTTGCTNGYSSIAAANSWAHMTARYCGFPGVGRHFLAWLEFSDATGTTTWYGDDGAGVMQSGISGEMLA